MQKYLYLFFISISILLKFASLNLLNVRIINSYSEIHLVIEGNGAQKILSGSFSSLPSEVIVNG